MRNKEIRKLVAGFRRFHDKYFTSEDSIYRSRLSHGQNPKTLIIGCSDSRVDPALISSSSPGELFIIRNVANLVPPYESASSGFHGISAAIEFAVVNLKVENVVILGHRQCGGIRALMSGTTEKKDSFIGQWMKIAQNAKIKVLEQFPKADFDSQCRSCEMEAIVASLENLKTFPFVKEAMDQREMKVLGIYFDLEHGSLHEFNEIDQRFQTIEIS